jgi:hypothetical protein
MRLTASKAAQIAYRFLTYRREITTLFVISSPTFLFWILIAWVVLR